MAEVERIIETSGATLAPPRSRAFTLETDVDVTELEGWRRSLSRGDAPHPTVEDAVAAAARVLVARSEIGDVAVAAVEGTALPVGATVLVVGQVRHESVSWHDEITDRLRVAISLGVERRVTSADAAQFLCELRELLEHPVEGLDLE